MVLVRSIYVYDSMTNHFEMGWYQDGNLQSVGDCPNFQTPHLLMYQQRNGAISCHPNPVGLTVGEDYSFKIANPDHNFTFKYYWDSDASPNILIGTYTGNFSHAKARSGDEHHNSDVADSLKADFTGMESMNSADVWGPFPSPALYTNNPVTGWTVCTWGGSTLTVRQSGNC